MCELENLIERLLELSPGPAIQEEDLPEEIRSVLPNASSFFVDLPEEGISLEAVERELIVRALDASKGIRRMRQVPGHQPPNTHLPH